MYDQKYLKYKKKCSKQETSNLLNKMLFIGGSIPDELTSSDINDSLELQDTEEIVKTEEEEEMEEKILNVNKYIGDSNITTDKINKIVQIGNAYGKIAIVIDFDKDEFTNIVVPHDKTKILEINNKDTFDKFTDKFGYVKKKVLKIDWETVARLFKGIYVTSAIENRAVDSPYLNKVMNSWVANEYKYIDDVIIFIMKENVKYEKKITSPFKGYIIDYYAIDEETFVNINDKITNDKILVINSIKHFDQFTNKYGKGSGIMWEKVKNDYIGLYLGDDKDMGDNRHKNCFFNGKLVDSWWYGGKLESGLVYMFH